MKLPFNSIIAPLIRPHLATTKNFCQHPTFSFSIFYTYFYSTLGLLISANHLSKHLGENPATAATLVPIETIDDSEHNFLIDHDLKIIATSMGLVQYACLLAGCYTENPALFLPHLGGQLIVAALKIVNAFLLMTNKKTIGKLKHRVPALILLAFNWLQEFCVFRQCLCICDL